jgi:hypothetical protein
MFIGLFECTNGLWAGKWIKVQGRCGNLREIDTNGR